MESVEPRAVAQPRVQAINREQMVLRPLAVEQLIPLDHPARAIWQLVGQCDLSRFYA
jgi:transposase